jgi:2-iminoacetate synthase
MANSSLRHQNFIDPDKIKTLIQGSVPTEKTVDDILNKALKLKGLTLEEVAVLLRADTPEAIQKMIACAGTVKEEIYGKRLVIFAPIYTGNVCVNNCTYCAFRIENKHLTRQVLNFKQIESEAVSLLKDGHKRVLLICGESPRNQVDYMCEAIRTVYAAQYQNHRIKRINVELAPMSVEDFKKIKAEHIGTYVCFQETYEPELYPLYHPAGTPKADYLNRLTVMDRAMEAGIDDVGLGVLFGLADYRFEVLALMEHARHLEDAFDCGPHTISFPRIEPADNAPLTQNIPYPVSDETFKKIIAIIRMALPYTGIILSTREKDSLRSELFKYGVSQVSAGSRTNPGAYANPDDEHSGSQFSLGDHRTLEEVISDMTDLGYVPSFCTGCYRMGRVGQDFMDLAKPGLIKTYCMPNALFSFKEYLLDFASESTRQKGLQLIEQLKNVEGNENLKQRVQTQLSDIEGGKRDVYF